jgi:TfoX/Sxy family transcriptional regulator of competence genes
LTPSQRFAAIVEEFRGKTGITVPSDEAGRKRKFGSSGLKVNDKVFTLLSSDGEFVVKLSRQRVEQLVASGDGRRFDPRRNGHVMKEWIVIAPTSKTDWLQLAKEARGFVGKK